MGQKVDPRGLRLGVNQDWKSVWYAEKDNYVSNLNNDIKIREFLEKELHDAAVSKIEIDRKKNRVDVKIFTAKPGVIIGHGGEDIEKLRTKIKRVCGETVFVTINDVKNLIWTLILLVKELLNNLKHVLLSVVLKNKQSNVQCALVQKGSKLKFLVV